MDEEEEEDEDEDDDDGEIGEEDLETFGEGKEQDETSVIPAACSSAHFIAKEHSSAVTIAFFVR